ncbi:PREDICTED: cellulose synthase-like protein G2 [Fragaria vesca subsp. vesca]|uniref:cellulose synthase-like protein G2 n=1 Tax=Fragaria vesca subsp. vesca TaxID=101020 RepID=UPI0002C30717|nr:PREDICTED: cellulose synthase-like protein G2 [Fragaria vesca subsp. vesca]
MDQSSSTTSPMNLCHVNKLTIFINRTYTAIHSLALSFLLYYRASFFFFHDTKTPTLPWLIVFAAELTLSFHWLLSQAFYWRPVSRTVFPERLPEDDKLPAVDVFICTADPEKEPPVEVMNTVISAMALDYPPEKLHVYLSDDGGADVTLHGMREAWTFAKRWIPFCKRYKIKCRSPKAYFSAAEDENEDGDTNFIQERQIVEEKYEVFKERVREYEKHGDTGRSKRRDHPAVIEVIQDSSRNHGFEENEAKNMPLLVYVSREKRPSHAHHFKAGALNVLLRVSGVISNSPFILGLDCDMFCNDPSSARQAMCFHLDPKLSPSLALVQFPQKFHNISKNDIYDSQLRSTFTVLWQGFDGLQGPCVSGTGYYIKRLSLYGRSLKDDQKDLMELRQSFGSSNEFAKSLDGNYKPDMKMAQLAETQQQLASCTYEDGTKWGEEAGYLYASVVEDYFTGFASLHCKGWNSVYCDPPRPQFLGSGTTNLNDFLVQGTRWSSGLVDVAISKYCPLIYGLFKMSFLECMCYAWLAIFPICYFFSLWCLATIPQLCLLNGISLYPEVSNSYFWIFSFVFLSSVFRHLSEVLTTGESLQHWIYEQRIWMMKSVTSQFYGSLDAFMKKFGLREASFFPTNKVDDVEQFKRYNAGIFDFQTSALFLVPLASLFILNMASLCVGIARVVFLGELEKLFIQVFIPFYAVVVNYPIIEGMLVRKDKGRIPASITLLSATASIIFCVLGSIIFM